MRVAVYLLVAVATVSLWTFWVAVRPPRLAIPGTPREYGLAAEDVRITTKDGLRLAGWVIPRTGGPSPGAARGGPAIIALHGYPAEKSDLLPTASALAPHFTTVLVDLRYFGASEGRATTLGSREREDLRSVVDFVAGRGLGPIGVFGYSLGGAIALMAAADDPRIRAIVAYAPFSDLRTLGRELYAGLWALRYPLVEAMILWGRLFLGADITQPSPVMAARRLAIPVLLVHSRGDDQIPFTHGERLREALAGNPLAEFHFTDRGAHNDRVVDLERRAASFFAKHLR